jgi:hypothetical protein
MHLAQDKRIDPTSRSTKPFPDAHGAQPARDDAAIDPAAIADEVVWSTHPREMPPLSDVQPILPSDLL